MFVFLPSRACACLRVCSTLNLGIFLYYPSFRFAWGIGWTSSFFL